MTTITSNGPDISKEYENTRPALLFKVKYHQVEMVRDRGYNIDDELKQMNIFSYSIENFMSVYGSKSITQQISIEDALGSVYQHSITNHRIYVVYLETPKGGKRIGLSIIKDVVHRMNSLGIYNGMMISEVQLTPGARLEFNKIINLNLEYFLYSQLAFNPTKHFLVPKHIGLTDEQKTDLFRQHPKLRIAQFPQISMDDPVARYYGFKPGQIVKIERNNLATPVLVNKTVSYRVVVVQSFDIPKEEGEIEGEAKGEED